MVAINGRQLTGPGWKGPGQNFPYGRVAIQRRGASVEELARQRQGLGRKIRKKGHLEKYNLTEAQKSRGRRSEITELRLAIKLEPDKRPVQSHFCLPTSSEEERQVFYFRTIFPVGTWGAFWSSCHQEQEAAASVVIV